MKKSSSLFFWLTLHAIAYAELALSPPLIDFGETTELDRPVLMAKLTNDRTNDVSISEIVRTCVCATLETDKDIIPSGGSATLRIQLNPNVFSGPFRKTFFVRTDDPFCPSIAVPLCGTVKPLWSVLPSKRQTILRGNNTATFTIVPAAGSPLFSRCAISGPMTDFAKATIQQNPDGSQCVSFSVPTGLPPGHHTWNLSMSGDSKTLTGLELHVEKDEGEAWLVFPARLRCPRFGGDFTTDILLRPAAPVSNPEDLDPATISLSPKWDRVTIEPTGPFSQNGIPFKLTVGSEQLMSWAKPKVFTVLVPGSGTASFRLDLVPENPN